MSDERKETFDNDELKNIVDIITQSKRKIGFLIHHAGNGECTLIIEKMKLIPDDVAWIDLI